MGVITVLNGPICRRFGRLALVALVLAAVSGAWHVSEGQAQQATLRDPNVLIVNIPKFWPPHYIADSVPKPTGFAIDLFDAIAERAGYRVEYRIRDTFKEAVDELYAGRADVVPNIGLIPSRKGNLLFTEPLETFIVSLYVRADTQGIGSLEDLRGKRVGTVIRNVGNVILMDHPDITPVVFNDIRTVLFELLAGRIDGLIYPVPVVTNLARDIGISHQIKRVGQPLREIKRGIGVHPSRPDVHRRLSAAVTGFVDTPEYQRIYAKYFAEKPKGWSQTDVLLSGGIGLAALVLLFSGWHYATVMRLNRRLERSIEKRTGELREAQAELVRSERLATLGQLTGTMAHELRNPLGAVVSSFEVIKHGARNPGHDISGSMERAERNIRRCTTIINELLDYAQVKAAQLSDVDIGPLVASVLDEYETPGFLTVTRDLADTLPRVSGDAEQLRRVIINFVDNARDAIADKMEQDPGVRGGTVRVTAKAVDGGVEVSIADDGVGIDPAELKRIFEPLYSTKAFGVGLGLPHAQNIVELHGGRIQMAGAPGQGAEMRVWFPAAGTDVPDRSAKQREPSVVSV